ncbi:recombinase family protein [Stutzerimonas stutzeri]|jgi:DNA invertase Pin-like site-specific DNA recombinase|uniref:Site-specific recombinase, DNA invertase Pin n=1 Tax=Stutzerimonas stutzeri RCH2 TaxID=644801 RepID=L0GNR8_STUST|nr:recombinase family protein [Stutzerimonas stutzeri]AGA87651.1 site-specific recombinase, DNA invertase Pin [Stutzerimonas stutzeri RCH2]
MATVGYVRVSTVDQNTERQLDGLTLDKVFEDKCSGKDAHRPALQALIEYVREGDTVVVHDISRMARNLEDLLSLVKAFNKRGVAVRFNKEGLSFTGEANPMQELMLSMLGAVYQFERSMMLERQREGIQQAKQAGKYRGGRPRVDAEAIKAALDSGLSIRKAAEALGVGISTVQRVKATA